MHFQPRNDEMGHRVGVDPVPPMRGRVLAATLMFLVLLAPTLAQAQRGARRAVPPAQGVIQLTQRISSETTGLALPRAPREMRRSLTRAQRAISDARYTDAVELLSEILQSPEAEDYFIPGEAGEPRSLKAAARDLLGGLPAAGREIYELQAGSTAKRLLAEAIETRSFDALNEVSRRYFHTVAGYQATYLMGRYCLDQGSPVAAAIHFRRLRDVGAASHDFEPDLSFYLAASWWFANNDSAALEALQYLQQRLPGASLEIAGQRVELPASEENLLTWLGSFLDDVPPSIVPPKMSWVMFRGDPARNGAFLGDAPIPKLEWHLPPTASPEHNEVIKAEMRKMQSSGEAPITAFHPLAVGDTVLMRTPHMLFGVNLKSGRRVWPFPWDTPEIDETALVGTRYTHQVDPIEEFIRQRLWEDGVNGQMSCRGSTVFLLQDLKPLGSLVDRGPQFNLLRRGLVAPPETLKENSNQLVALDIEADGKIRWIVGGKDGESPELANAFFLGAPLPLGDQLFVLAERQDEIRLCVLDADTGKLQWSQQIAQVESPFAWYLDPVRRLGGCSPSFADGCLICPTGSGLVVAVDIDSRSLLWSYEYRRDSVQSSPLHLRQMPKQAAMPESGKRWADNALLITGGGVLMTPIDSNAMHCVELLTGEKRWTKKRGDYLFVAGVYQDTAVLVGKHRVQGVGIADGRAVWDEPLDIPQDALPSGHGFLSDDVLHLPTTAQQLLRINVVDGTLLEQIPTDQVLGNLIGHGDYIISQSPTGVKAFLRRDRARAIVKQRLEDQPHDVETWETHASLLLGEGQVGEAIEALRQAASLAGDTDLGKSVRGDLVALLLRELEAGNESIDINEVEQLASGRAERKRICRVRLDRAVAEGRLEEAIQHCLTRWQLVAAQPHGAEPLVERESGWHVNERVWLRQKFDSLLAQLEPNRRQAALATIAAAVATGAENGQVADQRWWGLALPESALASDSDIRDTDRLLVEGRFLECELQLIPQLSTADPRRRATILGQLVRLYKITGAYQLARQALDELASISADNRPGVDVDELRQELRGSQGTSEQAPNYADWPNGAVEFEEHEPRGRRSRSPILVGVRPVVGWPTGWTLTYDFQENRLGIRNEWGKLARVVSLPLDQHRRRQPLYARAYGQLIVINSGGMIMAIDAIGDRFDENTRVLWTSDDPELFPESQRPEDRSLHLRNRNAPFGIRVNGVGPENLGPVSPAGVCFMRNGILRCVAPLTGETLWSRDDVLEREGTTAKRIVEVYGDDEYVLVQRMGEKEAKVFHMLDGALVDTVKVPPIDQQWVRSGRTLLTFQRSLATRTITLRAVDPFDGLIWETTLPTDSQGVLIERDEIATVTPEGIFAIRRIVDGQIVAQKELGALTLAKGSLQVSRSTNDYVVMISDRPPTRAFKDDGRSVSIQPAVNTGNRATAPVSGFVWAIDRKTGAELWDEPLQVHDFFVPDGQPQGVPWMIFMRKVIIDEGNRQQNVRSQIQQRLAMAMVDRRNGDVVFLKQDLTRIPRMFTMEADGGRGAVSVELAPNFGVQFKFTDDRRLESVGSLPNVQLPPRERSDDEGEDVEVELPQ